MTEEETETPTADKVKVEFLIHVRRGSMRVNYSVTGEGLEEYPGQLAQGAVHAMVLLMESFPDYPGAIPFEDNDIPIVLKLEGADNPLNPLIAMKPQFEGHWKPLDTAAAELLGMSNLPTGTENECSYVILDLVESLKSL